MARPKGKRPHRKQPPLDADGAPLCDPDGLRPRERLFVEAYCGVANYNISKAYELAGYKPHRENGSRLIAKDYIAAAVAKRVRQRVEKLIMDGDEALERISRFARADIRKLFPPESRIAQLPDEIALCIKSITPNRYGDRLELYDAQKAAETMAKVAGKLKETVKVEHALEDILAAANELEGEQKGRA